MYIRMSLVRIKSERTNTLQKLLAIERASHKSLSPYSPSSPDIELIRTLKQGLFIDNPLMRLSIEDYETMCKNKMIFTMMVKVLNTDKRKLKKICKNIHIFKKHINSSPETIKSHMKTLNLPILYLPEELRDKILNIYKTILTVELRDWIPIDKLSWNSLSINPNATKLLDAYPDKIDWLSLSANDSAVELIRKYVIGNQDLERKIDWAMLSGNTNAIDLLETKIKEDRNSVDWYSLSSNPEAIGILSLPEYRENIVWKVLSRNPNAIDLLENKWDEDKLLKMTDPIQYNRLKGLESTISWNILSGNPKAINLLRKKIAEEKNMPTSEYNRLEYSEKISWSSLSQNPEAIKLLQENKDKIVWLNLSSNRDPKAIKLLKEQVEYENRLPIEKYKKLGNKINWLFLSNNPNAIEILKANKGKIKLHVLSNNPKAIDILAEHQSDIDWGVLSGNPGAIRLLSLPENRNKIDWESLSGNPNAIDILEANQDKINWDIFSMNPSIFILK